ncbi:MAG: plasmid mobilization protein [Candidatus Sulfotelmatobacter sp.]
MANRSGLCKLNTPLLSGFHHFAILVVLLHCSYILRYCQAQTLLLTRSYIKATLWRMVKPRRKTHGASISKSLKDDVVRMRISAEQKQALTEAADRAGLELSAWLRQLALREAGVLPKEK